MPREECTERLAARAFQLNADGVVRQAFRCTRVTAPESIAPTERFTLRATSMNCTRSPFEWRAGCAR